MARPPRLANRLRDIATDDPETIADHLLDGMLDERRRDDVALVVYRHEAAEAARGSPSATGGSPSPGSRRLEARATSRPYREMCQVRGHS